MTNLKTSMYDLLEEQESFLHELRFYLESSNSLVESADFLPDQTFAGMRETSSKLVERCNAIKDKLESMHACNNEAVQH